jgi:site-specific DNA-methyltransferase (cytosine-N4-specific)
MPDNPSDLLPHTVATYQTSSGAAFAGDSRLLLERLPEESIDLIVTSPPYALRKEKEYGNRPPEKYNEWFLDFADRVYDVLADDGCFVIEIGGGWQKSVPVRSLYHFELLTELAGSDGPFCLAQDFYWYNPAKLPTPAAWVTVNRERAKDAVNHVWVLSKQPHPNADNRRVLQEYSDGQKRLMEDGYKAGERPSGHSISEKFDKPEEDGSIPPNLIEAANTNSSSHYLKACELINADPHPSRFPRDIPKFFIKFLSEPDDIVLDIFAGSNMTGRVAQDLDRRWLAFEIKEDYVKSSQLRFIEMGDLETALDAGLSDVETITQTAPLVR